MISLPSTTSMSPTPTVPAGRSVRATAPVGETVELTRVSEPGTLPSRNSRFPLPRTTGKMISRYSSISPASCRVWARPQLPCTWSSPPGLAFSCSTAATTSPAMTDVLCHSGSRRVRETTCLGRVFSFAATVSSGSVTVDQNAYIMSYVVRPKSTSSVSANQVSTTAPKSSSTNGTTQPPCSNPPVRSSSGPPGPCMTPSRLRNVCKVSFMSVSLSVLMDSPAADLIYSTNEQDPI